MVLTVPQIATPFQVTNTYTSLVDLEERTELHCVPTTSINGVKCAKLEKQDVSREVEYWNNAVLCSVLGANPSFEVIKVFIKRIWGSYEINKILQVRRGIFLVRFQNSKDKDRVIKKGIYHFDSNLFLVKGWNPNVDLCTETLKSLPI